MLSLRNSKRQNLQHFAIIRAASNRPSNHSGPDSSVRRICLMRLASNSSAHRKRRNRGDINKCASQRRPREECICAIEHASRSYLPTAESRYRRRLWSGYDEPDVKLYVPYCSLRRKYNLPSVLYFGCDIGTLDFECFMRARATHMIREQILRTHLPLRCSSAFPDKYNLLQ